MHPAAVRGAKADLMEEAPGRSDGRGVLCAYDHNLEHHDNVRVGAMATANAALKRMMTPTNSASCLQESLGPPAELLTPLSDWHGDPPVQYEGASTSRTQFTGS